MARKPVIEVEGARELRAALKKAGDDASDLKDANREVGELVVDAAKPKARHKSGAMAGSIRAARQASAVIVRAGGAQIPYAAVQHFGWPAHSIEPNPYIYSGLDERWNEIIEAYEKAIAEIVATI